MYILLRLQEISSIRKLHLLSFGQFGNSTVNILHIRSISKIRANNDYLFDRGVHTIKETKSVNENAFFILHNKYIKQSISFMILHWFCEN